MPPDPGRNEKPGLSEKQLGRCGYFTIVKGRFWRRFGPAGDNEWAAPDRNGNRDLRDFVVEYYDCEGLSSSRSTGVGLTVRGA